MARMLLVLSLILITSTLSYSDDQISSNFKQEKAWTAQRPEEMIEPPGKGIPVALFKQNRSPASYYYYIEDVGTSRPQYTGYQTEIDGSGQMKEWFRIENVNVSSNTKDGTFIKFGNDLIIRESFRENNIIKERYAMVPVNNASSSQDLTKLNTDSETLKHHGILLESEEPAPPENQYGGIRGFLEKLAERLK